MVNVNNLNNPISLKFNNLYTDYKTNTNLTCVYYDSSLQTWSSAGILSKSSITKQDGNKLYFNMECNTTHLSLFSIQEYTYISITPASSSSTKSGNDNALTLGLALGISIPVVLIIIGAFIVVVIVLSVFVWKFEKDNMFLSPLVSVSGKSSGSESFDPLSRYLDLVRIGQGAFGSVFKALDSKTNRMKAIKVIRYQSNEELNGFMKEGTQLMNVNHPNILKVNDFFISQDNLLCIDMDFYEKGDLVQLTKEGCECSEKILLQIMYQMLSALSYIHVSMKLIHRDIKPSNIFIRSIDNENIEIVIADFGLARADQGSAHKSYAGTPLFMSPELGYGGKYYFNTDIYSLGVTLYQIMTKDTTTSISQLLITMEKEEVKNNLRLKFQEAKIYSNGVIDLVISMLEKDFNLRPQAQDLVNSVHSYEAVSCGDINSLRQIDMSSFINNEHYDADGLTLLDKACENGHLEIVKLLLNVDGIDVNKNVALYGACFYGHLEIVKLLLNVNGIDINNSLAIQAVCRNEHLEIAKLILNVNGIDVNKGFWSPLFEACNSGYLEIVKLLLAKNAKINREERNAFDENIKTRYGIDMDLDKFKDQILLTTRQERIQELELINADLKKHIEEKEDIINTICEQKSKYELPPIKQVFNTSQNEIHSIKKQVNSLNNQITEIVSNNEDIRRGEWKQIIEERNKLRSEIVLKYTDKLSQFETEKKELIDQIERLDTTIREYQYFRETFEYVNKLKFKKEELLQALSINKDEIDDIEIEKKELELEIQKQNKQKKRKIDTSTVEINLKKKLTDKSEKINSFNEKQSEIQQELSFLLPNFPEAIIEMEHDFSEGVNDFSPEEKFRIFAIQNSILLGNTSLTDYSNRIIIHSGLSVVYKVTKRNNQVVILKEISLNDSNCDTVMNEIMNILRLQGHSRIIKLNGIFIEPHKVYIETPYYTNGNLLEYVNKIRTQYDVSTLRNQYDVSTLKTMLRVIFRKITETLQFIHSKDILHRDLKPQNILVNENGEPIIADFGSSKKLLLQLTNNTMGVGTLKYMAIEVKLKEEAPSEKSDIWSLGVSLFECWKLIQNQQYNSSSAAEILDFDINGHVKLPTSNLQDEIDILMMKMLSHMFETLPQDRPSALMILTDEEYFTHENAISVDILSRSNQELDTTEKLTLWQARLKKLKQLSLDESLRNEIKFEIHRTNLLKDISSIIGNVMKGNNKLSIFFKTFVKYVEERGIDQGGLSNELFSKYIESMLLESKQFQKSETSSIENFILTDEPLTEESRSQLKTFGWLLKKLLIDCDDKTVFLPLNSFIFYYLLNGDILKKKKALLLNDIILTLSKFLREYDFELDHQIMNSVKCKNDAELQFIPCEETFIDVLSKSEKPLIMENVQLFIISQLYSYFYTNEKIEKLELIKEGFDWFNLKQYKSQPTNKDELKEFLSLQGSDFDEQRLSVNELKILLSGQSYIDADLLLNEMNFSAISSTLKDFLTRCIRKLSNGQLRQLLCWMTALSSIPMRGFSRKISVREFSRFESHTCSFIFDIPSQISDFNAFETLFLNCLRLSSDSTMEDGL